MNKIIAVTVLLISPALFAKTYIHNSAPQVYGNVQVNQKEGYISYKSVKDQIVKVKLSDVSETTDERVNRVKVNEVTLLDGKICQVFLVAKSGRAEFTCRTGVTYKDGVFGKTHLLDKTIRNTSDAIPEVEELNGMRKGEHVKLQVPAGHIDSGEKVRIEAILANGDVLIRRTGFMGFALLQSGGAIVRDISVIKVNVADICKCN